MKPRIRNMMNIFTMVIILLLQLSTAVYGLENGLARTPPMGWMTWQRYRCQVDCKQYPRDCISEQLVRRTVDRLVRDGFVEAGYEYLMVDDCWQLMERDRQTSKLVADPERFPSGLKNLGDYIHEKGMKFGIYLDYGTLTCERYPGSMEYLELDANTVAGFGADYVKMDGCYAPYQRMPAGYEEFGKHLNNTGRPMVFACSYPLFTPWQQNTSIIDWQRLQRNCNLWRLIYDVEDTWQNVKGIIEIYRQQSNLLPDVAGPGHWNDPDMLVLGNFGLSHDQERVQMGLWCMFAAPLILSTEMEELNEESAKLIKNKMLIDIDQDAGGHQARFLGMKESVQIWMRPLTRKPNTWAVALFNTQEAAAPTNLPITLKELGIPSAQPESDLFTLVDVFTGEEFGILSQTNQVVMRVNPTGIVMYHVELRSAQ